jgi:putative transposase
MDQVLDKNRHSVYLLTYHLVLVIKYRKQVLNQQIYDRLIELFVKIGKNYEINLQESNFESDHIHFLFKAKPNTSLMKFINAYKSTSSRIIKNIPISKKRFGKKHFGK